MNLQVALKGLRSVHFYLDSLPPLWKHIFSVLNDLLPSPPIGYFRRAESGTCPIAPKPRRFNIRSDLCS
jgi:hypothetical protein